MISEGNAFADKTVKAAAEGHFELLWVQADVTQDILKEMQQQSPLAEKAVWTRKALNYREIFNYDQKENRVYHKICISGRQY